MNKGKCPTCYQCPRCSAILSMVSANIEDSSKVDSTNESYRLNCGMCCWVSTVYKGNDKNEVSRDIKAKHHSEDLKISMTFDNIIKSLTQKYDGVQGMKARQSILASSASGDRFAQSSSVPEETSNEDHKTNYHGSISMLSVNQRLHQNSNQHLANDIVPLRVPLRAKVMKRCKNDFEKGRMNILIQPKANPLEGDSSMRIQRGKWWMKDASAIHELPTITILKYPTFSNSVRHGIMRIIVSNPKSDANIFCRITYHPWQGAGEIERLIVLPEGHLSPYSLSYNHSIHPSNSSITKTEFVLEPYEDELLRDEDDDESALGDNHLEGINNDMADMSIKDGQTLTQSSGIASVRLLTSRNVAYLNIPVELQAYPQQDHLKDNVALFSIVLHTGNVGEEETLTHFHVKICIPVADE